MGMLHAPFRARFFSNSRALRVATCKADEDSSSGKTMAAAVLLFQRVLSVGGVVPILVVFNTRASTLVLLQVLVVDQRLGNEFLDFPWALELLSCPHKVTFSKENIN